jgi:hypothetical protein
MHSEYNTRRMYEKAFVKPPLETSGSDDGPLFVYQYTMSLKKSVLRLARSVNAHTLGTQRGTLKLRNGDRIESKKLIPAAQSSSFQAPIEAASFCERVYRTPYMYCSKRCCTRSRNCVRWPARKDRLAHEDCVISSSQPPKNKTSRVEPYGNVHTLRSIKIIRNTTNSTKPWPSKH